MAKANFTTFFSRTVSKHRMKGWKNLLFHGILLTILWPLFFFSTEIILKATIPEYHNVLIWLYFTSFGLTAIFLLVFISYLISSLVRRNLKRKKTFANKT